MEILIGTVKKQNDLKRIVDLAHETISHVRKWPNREAFDELIWRHLRDQSQLVVAYNDKSVVGFSIHHKPYKVDLDLYETACTIGGVAPPGRDLRVVELIAVDPTMQGKGIGKELLATTVGVAMSYGAREIYASCVGGEYGRSYAMFANAGFDKIRTIEGWYDDGSDVTDVVKYLYG